MSYLKMLKITVVRKFIMAATGLFLFMFLLEHLYGNLLLYKNDSGAAFNQYAEDCVNNVIIRIIEVVLVAGLLFHILDAIILSVNNKMARPVGYEVPQSKKNSSWYSRNMGFTGSIIFIFLALHLRTFFFEHRVLDGGSVSAEGLSDYYATAVFAFSHWWYSAIYFIAMIFLGAHLNHGLQSALNTLGLSNKHYGPIIKTAGSALAFLIALSFASFPVIFYFNLLGR